MGGIACEFTAFYGGVRYTKVYLVIRGRDFPELLEVAPCKPVESDSNVQIHVISSDELLHDASIIENQWVPSLVQVFLDWMRLRVRGDDGSSICQG